MPQLDISVFGSQGLNFTNFFSFNYALSFITLPLINGLLKSRFKIYLLSLKKAQ